MAIIPTGCFNLIQPCRSVQEINIDLDGKPENERIIILEDKNTKQKTVLLQKFDPSRNKWVVLFSKTISLFTSFDVQQGFWKEVEKKILILQYVQGSGRHLNYDVLGLDDDNVVNYLHREDLFQGMVWLEEGQIIESESNKYYIWKIENSNPVRYPYDIPAIPGAVVINYEILADHTVWIVKDTFDVTAGTTIQLVRTDDSEVAVRILLGNGTLGTEFLPKLSAFKLLQTGSQKIIIIPDGYDWDKARTITINII